MILPICIRFARTIFHVLFFSYSTELTINAFVTRTLVDEHAIYFADPLEGIVLTQRQMFQDRWMNLGVVMRK